MPVEGYLFWITHASLRFSIMFPVFSSFFLC